VPRRPRSREAIGQEIGARLAERQGRLGVADRAAPGAPQLDPAHPGVDHAATGSPGRRFVFLGAHQPRSQQGLKGCTTGRLITLTKGGDGGQAHRAVTLQTQLQVASVQEWIEPSNRQGQQDQG